ncbi:hypothetical protein [Candidatus Protochlamydia phocaeensis]|uniref:hypothetical protein n=1 Tax=Candidatus Protochlamydia phocaeensis TaxID=1414722 RepID=UPI000837EB23|nr:hypothetical protein [Candidatus Protochlamydia phocaeensis]
MKVYPFLILLLLPFGLFASDWKLEIRGAYFHPSNKKAREAYSNAWIDYQVEASTKVTDYIEAWAGVNWMCKRGHLDDYYAGFKHHSKMYVLPLSIGFKAIYPLTCAMDVYLGAGACYSFLKIKNDRDYSSSYDSFFDNSFFDDSFSFKKVIRRNGVGGVIKAGFQYTISKEAFLDFFVDYFSQRFYFSHSDTQTTNNLANRHFNASGFKIGGGLGVYF